MSDVRLTVRLARRQLHESVAAMRSASLTLEEVVRGQRRAARAGYTVEQLKTMAQDLGRR